MTLHLTVNDHDILLHEIMTVGIVDHINYDMLGTTVELKTFTVSYALPSHEGVYIMDENQTIEQISSEILHFNAIHLEDY